MAPGRSLSISQRLFVQALNEMFDLQSQRVAHGLHFGIPLAVWLGLYVVSVLAMIAVGYQFGFTSHRQYLLNLLLAMAFSSVIILIADFDRLREGAVQLNEQPIVELLEKLKKNQ